MTGQPKTSPSLTPVHIEALFQSHSGELFKYACHLTRGHPQNAEDLLIETFVCLAQYARAPVEDIQQNPYAYLSRIMMNVYLADRRRQKTQRREAELPAGSLDLDDLVLAHPEDLEQQHEQQEMILQACRYALMRMKSSNRGRVLLLRYFLGYTPQEISRVLGMSAGAVDKALSQARSEVREFVEASGPTLGVSKKISRPG
jgi:RNA polymerase sigma factor (sigma-70 family)